jgi:hypothetical protein
VKIDLWDRVADRLAARIEERLEAVNELPLPQRMFDVVVDDPDMSQRHDYRFIAACSSKAAGIEAYRRAIRDEGFRVCASHRPGDETTVDLAGEFRHYATVHETNRHPVLVAEGKARVVVS